eukprot:gene23543-30525_t
MEKYDLAAVELESLRSSQHSVEGFTNSLQRILILFKKLKSSFSELKIEHSDLVDFHSTICSTLQSLSRREEGAIETALRRELNLTQQALSVTECVLNDSQRKQQQLEDRCSEQQKELLKFLMNKEHSQHEETQTSFMDSDTSRHLIVKDCDVQSQEHIDNDKYVHVHVEPVTEVSISEALLNSELTLAHLELTATRNELLRSDENLKLQLETKTILLKDLQDSLMRTRADLAESVFRSDDLSLQVESYKQLLIIEEKNHSIERSKLEFQLDESIVAMRQQQQTIQEANAREGEFAQCRILLTEELTLSRQKQQLYSDRCTQQRALIHEQAIALDQARAALMNQQDEMGALSQHIAAVLADSLTPERKARSYSQMPFAGNSDYKSSHVDFDNNSSYTSSNEFWKWLEHLIQLSLELHEAVAFAVAHSRKLSLSNPISGEFAMLSDIRQRHHDLHAVIVSSPWTNEQPAATAIAFPEMLDLSNSHSTLFGTGNTIYGPSRANKSASVKAAEHVEDKDMVRVSLHSEGVTHSSICDSVQDNDDDCLVEDIEEGEKAFSGTLKFSTDIYYSSGVAEIASHNRSYSFTNRDLREQSFESAMSEIWNISTDYENEHEWGEEK